MEKDIIKFEGGQITGLPPGHKAYLAIYDRGRYLAFCGKDGATREELSVFIGDESGMTNGKTLATTRHGNMYYFRIGNREEIYQYEDCNATWMYDKKVAILLDKMNLLL